MKLLIKLSVLLLLLSFIGCSSVSYNSDYDPAADFASFKTYSLYKGDPVQGDELYKYPLVQKRLENSVDKALAAKGLTKVESDNADVVIILHAGLKEKTQLNTYSYGGYGYGRYGYGWGGTGGMSTTDVVTYDEELRVAKWRQDSTGEFANCNIEFNANLFAVSYCTC